VIAAELAPSAELAGAVAEEAMLVGLLVALDADDEAAPELLGQVRSYRGALLRSAPFVAIAAANSSIFAVLVFNTLTAKFDDQL